MPYSQLAFQHICMVQMLWDCDITYVTYAVLLLNGMKPFHDCKIMPLQFDARYVAVGIKRPTCLQVWDQLPACAQIPHHTQACRCTKASRHTSSYHSLQTKRQCQLLCPVCHWRRRHNRIWLTCLAFLRKMNVVPEAFARVCPHLVSIVIKLSQNFAFPHLQLVVSFLFSIQEVSPVTAFPDVNFFLTFPSSLSTVVFSSSLFLQFLILEMKTCKDNDVMTF